MFYSLGLSHIPSGKVFYYYLNLRLSEVGEDKVEWGLRVETELGTSEYREEKSVSVRVTSSVFTRVD